MDRGLTAVVDLVEELGADAYLYAHAEIGGNRVDIVARADGRRHPAVGDSVVLAPKSDHVHLFDLTSDKRLPGVATPA